MLDTWTDKRTFDPILPPTSALKQIILPLVPFLSFTPDATSTTPASVQRALVQSASPKNDANSGERARSTSECARTARSARRSTTSGASGLRARAAADAGDGGGVVRGAYREDEKYEGEGEAEEGDEVCGEHGLNKYVITNGVLQLIKRHTKQMTAALWYQSP